MGIKGLKRLIMDNAPSGVKLGAITNYFGRAIAIDASMFLYSFLVAIRTDSQNLTDVNGETTSHLQGLFNRTIRLLECGVKPVYVFDGKPPRLKNGELAKRNDRKREAMEQLEAAQEAGDEESIAKLVKRTVKVTSKHNEEGKRLLRLLGVPVVEAPSDAEAQCASLCKSGKVWAVGTEDMDALTFSSPILLRHITYAESRKEPIAEIYLDKVLQELGFTMSQFVDLNILLGCDYCGSIKGVGPKRALELIKKYGSLEALVENIDKSKHSIPDDFQIDQVRDLFFNPEVIAAEEIELVWKEPDEKGLKEFLVDEKNFNEARITSALMRIKKGKSKSGQERLDTYFKPLNVGTKRSQPEPPLSSTKGRTGALIKSSKTAASKPSKKKAKTAITSVKKEIKAELEEPSSSSLSSASESKNLVIMPIKLKSEQSQDDEEPSQHFDSSDDDEIEEFDDD